MKKYLIRISGLTDIEFNIPLFHGRKSEILSKVLLSFGVLSLFVFIILLPSLSLFFAGNFENTTFGALILFVVSIVAFLGAFFVLQGKKVIVDPQYFLVVLFFALLTTAASVLRSPAHITNTFGNSNARSLSGITIMCLVGFFYFFSFVVKDSKMLKRFTSAFNYSLVIFLVLVLFHTNISDVNFVNSNLPIVLFAYFYLIISLFLSKSNKILKAILIAVSAIFVFLSPQTIPDSLISTQSITIGILAIIILSVIYAGIRKDYLSEKVKELKSIKTGFKEKKYSLSEVSYFLLILVSIIAVIVGVLVHFRFNFTANIILAPLDTFVVTLRNLFTGNLNLSKILIGGSAYDAVTKSSNLNTSSSILTNVLITQGLVGLIAYLVLFGTGILVLIKSIRKSLQQKSHRVLVALSGFSLLFVTLYSVITYPGELFTIVWWFSFVSLTVFLAIKSLTKVFILEDWRVSRLFLKDKPGIYLRVLVSVIVLILGILTVISITKITV